MDQADGSQPPWARFRLPLLSVAFVFAARGALRGATLAVAGSLMLGWLSSLPGALEQGIDFRAGDGGTPVLLALSLLALSPLVAVAAAALAWRGSYPIAAALLASSMTIVGLNRRHRLCGP
ncbi:MAG: hypothetical protein KL863_21140 [Rhizobium sp.]|nr:hypothetical protein [Rhizobium sp.]